MFGLPSSSSLTFETVSNDNDNTNGIRRQSKFLPLSDKVRILCMHEQGVNVTTLSKLFGVAKSTICKIKLQKSNILDVIDRASQPADKRTMKPSKCPALEDHLYAWYLAEKQTGQKLVSGRCIKEKALELHRDFPENGREFVASTGWLQRFKKRYGIGTIPFVSASATKLVGGYLNKDNPEGETMPTISEIMANVQHQIKEEDPLDIIDGDINLTYHLEPMAIPTKNASSQFQGKVTHSQAIESFDIVIKWAEENSICFEDVLMLKKLREKAIKLNERACSIDESQRLITSYFRRI